MNCLVLGWGINVHGWLSPPEAMRQAGRRPVDRGDYAFIRDQGFDHVRLPFSEMQLWDDDGHAIVEAWDRADAALDWCEQTGLKAVLDLHVHRAHPPQAEFKRLFTDPDAPAQFAALWVELSRRFDRRADDLLAYDLLNEPAADDPEDWNRAYGYAFRAIREREAQRTIIIAGNGRSHIRGLRALRPPQGDRHVMLAFRFFDPVVVTHCGVATSPVGRAWDGPVHYPGRPIAQADFDGLPSEDQTLLIEHMRNFDASVLEAEIAEAAKVGRSTGLPVYCSAFGIGSKPPLEVRRRWVGDVCRLFAKHEIGWASWVYKDDLEGGFGLFGPDHQPSPIAEVLLSTP